MSSLSKPTRESFDPAIPGSGGFNRLPNEILLAIAQSLGLASELYALRLVNKRLSFLLESFLSDILLRAYLPLPTRHHLFSVGSRNTDSLVRHLVRLGIDLNEVNSRGWPVLHIAVLHGIETMVRSLLLYGARSVVPNTGSLDNAVHTAIETVDRHSGPLKIPQEDDLAILDMLLANGVLQTMNDATSINKRGLTWLNLAVRSCQRTNTTVVQPFLVPGLSLDIPDNEDKRTPLHVAVCHNKLDLVTALLDLGANHRTIDCHGQSPFATACNRPNCVIIDLLLRRDATLFDEVVGYRGETAEMCMQESVEKWIGCEGRFKGRQKQYYSDEMARRREVAWKLTKLVERRAHSVTSDSDLQIYYNSL